MIPSVGILIGSVGILNCRDYDCRDFDCRDFDTNRFFAWTENISFWSGEFFFGLVRFLSLQLYIY